MADERAKKVVTSVVLIAVFLVVSIYIGLTIMKIYTQSSKYSSAQSTNSVNCVGYVYSISNIHYNNGLLTFDVKNSELSDYEEMNLILATGKEKKEIILTNLITGLKKEVSLEINIEDGKFISYPKNCEQDAQKHII